MRVASCFSGIGGLDEGLRRAGHEHVFLCESDSWRRKVLREHFPGVPVFDDVREVAVGKNPWNKGKSYTIAKKHVYANKGSWSAAMKRTFGNACMSCSWDKAGCDTHHIIPKREGGEMTLENGILLCPNCHRLADREAISCEELREMHDSAKVIGQRVGVTCNASEWIGERLARTF